MAVQYKYTKWKPDVFKAINHYREFFDKIVASPALSGVSAPPLAGAMAKEMHKVDWKDNLMDIGAIVGVSLLLTHLDFSLNHYKRFRILLSSWTRSNIQDSTLL